MLPTSLRLIAVAVGNAIVASGSSAADGHRVQTQSTAPNVSRPTSMSNRSSTFTPSRQVSGGPPVGSWEGRPARRSVKGECKHGRDYQPGQSPNPQARGGAA